MILILEAFWKMFLQLKASLFSLVISDSLWRDRFDCWLDNKDAADFLWPSLPILSFHSNIWWIDYMEINQHRGEMRHHSWSTQVVFIRFSRLNWLRMLGFTEWWIGLVVLWWTAQHRIRSLVITAETSGRTKGVAIKRAGVNDMVVREEKSWKMRKEGCCCLLRHTRSLSDPPISALFPPVVSVQRCRSSLWGVIHVLPVLFGFSCFGSWVQRREERKQTRGPITQA